MDVYIVVIDGPYSTDDSEIFDSIASAMGLIKEDAPDIVKVGLFYRGDSDKFNWDLMSNE